MRRELGAWIVALSVVGACSERDVAMTGPAAPEGQGAAVDGDEKAGKAENSPPQAGPAGPEAREIPTAPPSSGAVFEPPEVRPVSSMIPGAKLKELSVSGPLDRAVVKRVIDGDLAAIRRCHELELLAKGSNSGDVKVTFTIDSAGALVPETLVVAKTMGDSVVRCITPVVSAWTFPGSAGGVDVALTLDLAPG